MKTVFFTLSMWFIAIGLQAQILSPEEFQKQAAKKKGIIIDVRTPEEYEPEHIPNAINIDVKNPNFRPEIEKLDRNKDYFVYCGLGKRSAIAIEIMKETGFTKLYDLEKGLKEWKSKGLPTTKK